MQHTITLQEIISSLDPDSATRCITSLRKTILSKFIEPAISSRGNISVDGSAMLLELGQSSSDVIQDLKSLMGFLMDHLFASLPSQHYSQLVGTLIPQLQSSLLEHLKRTIPALVTALPQYIHLVERAVALEATTIQTNATATGSISLGRPINDWATKLSSHYEKRRRELILQDVRNILCDESRMGGIRVEIPSSGTKVVETVRSNGQPDVGGGMPEQPAPANSLATSSVVELVDEDGWGFDELDPEVETEVKEAVNPITDSPPADATTTEEVDPWDDDPWDDSMDTETAATSSQPQVTVVKSAKGLEKFSSKSKGSSVSAPPTNGSVHSINGTDQISASSVPSSSSSVATSESLELPASNIKETFLVSECAQAVRQTLRAVVQEGQDLAQSRWEILFLL